MQCWKAILGLAMVALGMAIACERIEAATPDHNLPLLAPLDMDARGIAPKVVAVPAPQGWNSAPVPGDGPHHRLAARVEHPSGSSQDAGGVLPFLSIIGFGVLVGGTASAMKTRL
jgi:hypothetical protein